MFDVSDCQVCAHLSSAELNVESMSGNLVFLVYILACRVFTAKKDKLNNTQKLLVKVTFKYNMYILLAQCSQTSL